MFARTNQPVSTDTLLRAIDINVWNQIAGMISPISAINLYSACRALWQRLRPLQSSRIAYWRAIDSDTGLIEASAHGDLELVRVYSRTATYCSYAIYKSRRAGHNHIVDFLGTSAIPLYPPANWGVFDPTFIYMDIVDYADNVTAQLAYKNNPTGDLYSWLKSITPTNNGTFVRHIYMILDFTYHGDLEAIKCSIAFIYNDANSVFKDQIFKNAALRSHINILEWGLQCDITRQSADVTGYAASIGNMRVLEWFADSTDVPITANAIYNGVIAGHLSVLEFAVERGVEIDYHIVCDYAVQKDHPHIVKWLLEHDLTDLSTVAQNVVRNGRQRTLFEFVK